MSFTAQDAMRSLEMLKSVRTTTIETIQQELGNVQKTIANINEQYEKSKAV